MDMRYMREEAGKETLVADAEELQGHRAPRRKCETNRCEGIHCCERRPTFIFPCANGMVKFAGKCSEVRTSDQIRQGPEKMEAHGRDHPGEEVDKFDLAEQQQDAMEAMSGFWRIP